MLAGAGACIVAAMAAGGGHGTYWAAKCLFPFTMLSTGWTATISMPTILIALLQFPVYGIVLAVANARRKVVWALWGLAGVHLACVALALAFSGSAFYP